MAKVTALQAKQHEQPPAKPPVETGLALVPELPEFEAFRGQVLKHANAGLYALALGARHGIEIGRMIVHYAERPEVVEIVAGMNADRRAKKEGGADKKTHTYVVDRLRNSGVELSEWWLNACARGYMNAKAKGLPDDVGIRNALKYGKESQLSLKMITECGGQLDGSELNIEGLFPAVERPKDAAEQEKENAEKPKPKFRDFIDGFTRNLTALEQKVGQPAIHNKRNQEQWAAQVGEWFAARGIKIAIEFVNGR